MGYPANTYSLFYAAFADPSKRYRERFEKAFERFRLFAFVIHDPAASPDLERLLVEEFEDLDAISGPHVLFFSVVQPHPETIRHIEGRPYAKVLSEIGLQGARAPIEIEDRSLAACILSDSLGLDEALLPVIVVCRELGKGDYLFVPTSGDDFQSDLANLQVKAIEIMKVEQELQRRITGVELLSVFGIQPNDEPRWKRLIGEAMYDGLGLVIATERNQFGPSNLLDVHLNELVNRLESKLKFLRSIAQEYTEIPESLSNDINRVLLLLGHIAASQRDPISQSELRVPTGLEPVSAQRLISAPHIANVIVASARLPAEQDLSPAVISLCKAIETEVGLSITEWIRERLEIPMPKYFNMFAPAKTAVLETGRNYNVDLNREWKGVLRKLDLGTAYHTAITARNTFGWPEALNNGRGEQLLPAWDSLLDLRNDAAHERRVDAHMWENLVSTWNEKWVDLGLTDALTSLKATLRGDLVQPRTEGA